MPRRSPWWRSHFDDLYFRLHAPLFPPELSRRETAGIIERLGLPLGSRVLDAPCGWGRHTDLLRQAGHDAFGADLSPDLIRRAPRRGRGRNSRFPYAAADIRALPFPDSTFDAVINIFTSLGLFDSDRDDVKALREAARVLVPGGRLLLETMHRDDVVAAYADTDTWRLPDGTRVRAERRFDAITGISHETWTWKRGSQSGTRTHALRLRTATDVVKLIERAGFVDLKCAGDWDGESFTHRSSSLIIVAEKAHRRLPERGSRR